MSFAGFLKQVFKILFGYGGGAILILAGIIAFAQGDQGLGAILFIVGFILALYGVYSERGL